MLIIIRVGGILEQGRKVSGTQIDGSKTRILPLPTLLSVILIVFLAHVWGTFYFHFLLRRSKRSSQL